MFKKILAVVPLMVFGFVTLVFAQGINKYFHTRQECAPLPQMMGSVVNEWGETALFTGEIVQFSTDGTPFRGGTMMFVNQDTGTWSLISLYGDGTACMAAVGTNFEPYSR